MTLLRLRAASRTYPGTPPVRALLPTDLTVEGGEFVAIQGPSGSGKSTLLNLRGLLDVPTSGSYEIDAVDTSGMGDAALTALRRGRVARGHARRRSRPRGGAAQPAVTAGRSGRLIASATFR